MKDLIKIFEAEQGNPDSQDFVFIELYSMGRDKVALIDGGQSHVGAVSVAGQGIKGAIPIPGHKEGPLCDQAASRLSRAARCSVAVICGIHYEEIEKSAIGRIETHVSVLLDEAEAFLQRQAEA